jgi:hypothetical protein
MICKPSHIERVALSHSANHKLVALVEVIEGAGKLGASSHAFAGCSVGIDHAASETLERLDLPREVLLLRADARVAD